MLKRLARRLSDVSIKQKLFMGFGLMLGLLLMVALFAGGALWLMQGQISRLVEQDAPLVAHSLRLEAKIKETEAALGLYLLGGEAIHKQNYQQNLLALQKILASLRDVARQADNKPLARQLKTLAGYIEEFQAYRERMLELANHDAQNFPALSYAVREVNPQTQAILQGLSLMLQEELNEGRRIELLSLIQEMRYVWANLVTEVRAFLAFRNREALDNVELFRESFAQLEQRLERGFGAELSFIQEDELRQIKDRRKIFFERFPVLVDLHESEKWRRDAYLIRHEITPILQRMDRLLKKLARNQLARMEQNRGLTEQWLQFLSMVLFAMLGLAVLAGVGGAFWLSRSITHSLNQAVEVTRHVADGDLSLEINVHGRDEISQLLEALHGMVERLSTLLARIQESGIQLGASTAQIAATARQQEATTQAQARASTEILGNSERIHTSTQELATIINQVTDMAEQTANSATEGQKQLRRMEDSMRNMLQGSMEISNKLSMVREKADNIGTVVTTIAKIADQTNLLSLNAAIQAEKAGEHGLGFGVVASEIRRLADQTATATWDIEQIVGEMRSAVRSGVQGMREFNEQIQRDVDETYQISQQLAGIIQQVQALIPHFETVRAGMDTQIRDAREISGAINDLAESARETAESITHSNQAIQQLKDTAGMLHQGVSVFKVKSNSSN